MSLTMKLEAMAGDEVAETALRMQRIADTLGVIVEVAFNDVKLFAVPGGSPRWLVDNFHSEAARKGMLMRPRWAWSHKAPTAAPPSEAKGEKP